MIIGNYIGIGYYGGGQSAEMIANSFKTRVEADGGVYEANQCLIDRIQSLKDKGFWDYISAAWIPHGAKANKFYAVKGGSTADFAFTRAGTRTRKAATYLETVATGVPALDYTGSTCPALSLEKASTNLLLWSEAFDNASWTKVAATITANAVAGPENLSTADAFNEDASTGGHAINQSISKAASALDYTLTIYAKPAGRDWIVLTLYDGAAGNRYWFNVSTGVVGSTVAIGTGFTNVSASISSTPINGFYRCHIKVTSSTATSIGGYFNTASIDGDLSTVGLNGAALYIHGAQLEQASYATSYIKTEAATVSRVADAVTALTGVSSLIGQTEGTLYFEGSSFADGTAKHILSISDGTDNNRVQIYTAATNVIGGFIANAGVSQALVENTGFVTGTNYKIAFTYKSNKAALFINGVKIGEDLTVTVPACSRIATEPSGTAPFYGNGKVWAISKTAISDSQAITLTT